eukprot:tig00021013_g17055.t1
MHVYRNQVVSNFLKERHPYKETPPPAEPEVSLGFGPQAGIANLAKHIRPPVRERQCIEALRVLEGLVNSQESKALAISQPQLVEDLVLLLSHEQGQIRKYASGVSAKLVSIKQGWEAMQLAAGLATLCSLMTGDDEADVRANAARALEHVALSSDGAECLSLGVEGVVAALVAGTLDPDSRVHLACLQALGSVLRLDSAVEQGVEAGVMKNLASVLKQSVAGARTPETGETRLRAMKALYKAVAPSVGKRAAIQEGLLPLLGRALTDSDGELRRLAAGAVALVAVEVAGKAPAGEAALEGLISLLRDPIPAVQKNAITALRNVAEEPRVRQRLKAALQQQPDLAVLTTAHPSLAVILEAAPDTLYYRL